MNSSLTAAHVRLTLQATERLELEPQPGSALRGLLFQGLWERFCVNKSAPECARCPLVQTCPVSALVAPLREENPRGRDVPRPFVIRPPLIAAEGLRLEPGHAIQFGLTLFGSASALFPYVVMAAQVMERNGLGRALDQDRRRHGRLRIERIEAVHPFTRVAAPLFTRGCATVHAPVMTLTATDVRERARSFSTDRITLHFLTPTRLIAQGHLVAHPDFQTLALRLLERLEQMERAYGGDHSGALADQEETERGKERYQQIKNLAQSCQLVSDQTRWVEVKSYSSRTRRLTNIGGFVGQATFTLPPSPLLRVLREILVWGEILHAGKNTVKGNGWYRIEA